MALNHGRVGASALGLVERHEPEKTLLHEVVRAELVPLLARGGSVGAPVARLVDRVRSPRCPYDNGFSRFPIYFDIHVPGTRDSRVTRCVPSYAPSSSISAGEQGRSSEFARDSAARSRSFNASGPP